MNAAQLLAHFHRISDAPDAIPRLRRFVLDLAVRGKLVEQDLDEDEVDHDYVKEPHSDDLPANWRLLNFGKFCDIQGGNQPPKSQFISEPCRGYVRLFQIRDLGESPVPTYIPEGTTNRFCRQGEILIGRYGASVGKIFWAQDGAYNVALAKFIYPENAFTTPFAFQVLKSNFFQAKLTGATRSAQAGFNKGDLADIDLPLPPLAEQHRIVAKVDELMALCDRLEAAQTERESRRDRLAAASLHRLNNGADADAFCEHARFHLRHLPRLTTRPEQIQQLRQAILNLAVRGRLVPQDPNDEPVSELLLAGDAERQQIAKKDRRADSALQTLLAEDQKWDVPVSWAWRGLADLVLFIDYRGQTPSKVEAGIRLITAKNVKKGFVNLSPEEFLTEATYKAWMTRGIPKEGDVLFTTEAPIGNAAVVRLSDRFALAQRVINFRRYGLLDPEFLVLQLLSEPFTAILDKTATGMTAKGIKAAKLKRLPIVIPPLAEQHRIVAKVDELMALCNRLEAQLTTAQTESHRLLEAVLYEALAPTG